MVEKLVGGGVYNGNTTLPYNGPIGFQTAFGAGDLPGVKADKYGNFWYCATEN